jgi:fluoride exporter
VSWAALALMGGLGAVTRFLISRALPVPYGTLVVNVTGAFALGLISGDFVFGTGFVGAYTTFSTWMLESHGLSRRAALLNIAASLALGLAAAQAGIEVRLHG